MPAPTGLAPQLRETFNTWFENNIPKHRFICEQIERPDSRIHRNDEIQRRALDTELMEKKKAEAEEHLVELRTRIKRSSVGRGHRRELQHAGIQEYLYKTENLPVLKTTTKYAEAADDEAIQLLRAYCSKKRPELVPFFDTVQEFRKWAKIKSTYIDGYMKWINTATGRIHPDLMPMGTDTGRFASRKPNLQNMPRKGSDRSACVSSLCPRRYEFSGL